VLKSGTQNLYGNLLNVINFSCTLYMLLQATVTVIDTFLSGYKRKEIMKSLRVKTMMLVQAEKWHVKT